jgi:berberine-like enzyme
VPVTAEQYASGTDVAVSVIGQLDGTPQEMADIFRPVFSVAPPSSVDIEQMAYWDGQAFLEEEGPPDHYQERSRFFGPMPDGAISTIFDWARRWPGSSETAEVKFFQTGDRMNTVPSDATAFVHRDSRWLGSISVNWGTQDSQRIVQANLDWQAGLYGELLTFTSGGAYQNFPDPSLTDWQQSYYGNNLKRLEAIKSSVDPRFFFRFDQAIPPTGWAHGRGT